MRLTRAAQAGQREEAEALDAEFAPLWALFRAHGSLRVMYAIAYRLSLPLVRVQRDVVATVDAALDRLGV